MRVGIVVVVVVVVVVFGPLFIVSRRPLLVVDHYRLFGIENKRGSNRLKRESGQPLFIASQPS